MSFVELLCTTRVDRVMVSFGDLDGNYPVNDIGNMAVSCAGERELVTMQTTQLDSNGPCLVSIKKLKTFQDFSLH
jgi:hypothetical protein